MLSLTGNSLASEQNGESESADVKEKQAEPSSDSKDSPLDPVNNQNETREDEDDDDEDEIFDGEAESTNVAPPPTLIERTEEVESKDEQTPQQPSAESQKSESEQTFEVNESAPESTPMKTLDVITIIGNQQKLQRASGSAFRVSKKLLETLEHDDVHRVLKQVPGVYIRAEDGFGLRPNIGLRGASSDRSAKVSLMEDGVLMAPAPYAAPAAYYFPLTTRLSGMEVFKGPSAIKYGPNTIGGALNFTTRSSVPRGQRGEIDIAMGSFGAQKVHAYFGQGARGFGHIIEGARIDSNGFKDLTLDKKPVFRRMIGCLKGTFRVKLMVASFIDSNLNLDSLRSDQAKPIWVLQMKTSTPPPIDGTLPVNSAIWSGHAPKRNCITRDSLGRT